MKKFKIFKKENQEKFILKVYRTNQKDIEKVTEIELYQKIKADKRILKILDYKLKDNYVIIIQELPQ